MLPGRSTTRNPALLPSIVGAAPTEDLAFQPAWARMKTDKAFWVLKGLESAAVAPVTEHLEGLARGKVRIPEGR